MEGREGNGKGACAGLVSGMMAALMAGCLEQHPLVEPRRIYDANAAISGAWLSRFDSAAIHLVDKSDSDAVLELWSGRPDTLGRLPTYVAEEGRNFFYRIEGFAEGGRPCYSEHLDQGRRLVRWDSCATPPFRIRVTPDSLRYLSGDFTLPVQVLPSRADSRPVTVQPQDDWVAPVPPSLVFSRPEDRLLLHFDVDWVMLPPGRTSTTWIRFLHEGQILDSIPFHAERKPENWIVPDSVDFGAMESERTLDVTIPFGAGADWLRLPDLPWLSGSFEGGSGGRPGAVRRLKLLLDRAKLPSDARNFAMIRAYGDSGRVVDSLPVWATNAMLAGVRGRVVVPVQGPEAGIRILVSGRSEAAETDSLGDYSILGLPAGLHTLVAQRKEGVGAVCQVKVNANGYGEPDRMTVTLSRSFEQSPYPDGEQADAGAFQASSGRLGVVTRDAGGVRRLREGMLGWDTGWVSDQGIEMERIDSGRAGAATGAFLMAPAGGTRFFSQPMESRLLRHAEGAGTVSMGLSYQPFGLCLAGKELAVTGRSAAGHLLLGAFDPDSLRPLRLDTLEGAWYGAGLPREGPRLITDGSAYFVAEGNGGGGPSRLHRVPRIGGKGVSAELPCEEASDVVLYYDHLHVGCRGPSSTSVLRFDTDLKALPSLVTGEPVQRLGLAEGWALKLLLVATTRRILIFSHEAAQPVGWFPLPEGARVLGFGVLENRKALAVATAAGLLQAKLE